MVHGFAKKLSKISNGSRQIKKDKRDTSHTGLMYPLSF